MRLFAESLKSIQWVVSFPGCTFVVLVGLSVSLTIVFVVLVVVVVSHGAHQLASGEFVEVFEAIDDHSNKAFILKKIDHKKVEETAGAVSPTTQGTGLRAVQAEIEALQILRGCPNVVQLVSVHKDDEFSYLVLEDCDRGNLAQFVASKPIYTEREAASIFKSVLQALNYMDELHVVHRDIKPENILLSPLVSVC